MYIQMLHCLNAVFECNILYFLYNEFFNVLLFCTGCYDVFVQVKNKIFYELFKSMALYIFVVQSCILMRPTINAIL